MSAATTPNTSSVVREILKADIDMSADEVIAKAKEAGVKAADAHIRSTVHTLRSSLKKTKSLVAPAQVTKAPAIVSAPAPVPAMPTVMALATADEPKAALSVAEVFKSISTANKVVKICGGLKQSRILVEGIRACGGLEMFLQQVELLEEVKDSPATERSA